ncbi:MAG TPA: hypothetical protein VNW97_12560 [Candidatus Saccharimonadales bacterium]|jgi:hypothetical protein|nr:hypothetical protein [Candidatus Saccharimonadales bacterium]
MKNPIPKTNKPSPRRFTLIERKFPGRRFVEFPRMKGRTVDKIELFTTSEYHSITVSFLDKTALTLVIDPGFKLKADYQDRKSGDARKVKSWPAIASE